MKKITTILYFFCLGLMLSSCDGIKDIFNKKKPELTPVISTTTVSNIKTTSVTVSSTIKAKGTKPTTEYGFCYAITSEFSIADAKIALGSTPTDNQEINTEIKTLQPNTLYYVKAYITQENNTTVYGTVAQFTTASLQAPKVTTADATDIKFNAFSITGQLTDIGTSDVTEYGHALSETNKEPTTADVITKMGTVNSAPKDFKSVFTALKANTFYYVRAYATNATGTGYSEVKTVKTGALELAKVQTIAITNISFSTANVSGKITEQGTNPITDFGHVISKTNQNPTTADTKTSLGVPSAIPKDFVSSFTSLELNTTYYTRSYAISEAGIAYGEVKSFKTLAKTPPTLTTKDISNITHNTAIVSGNIAAQGSHPINDYGHVISKTNKTPTTADTKTSLGATTVPKDFLSTFNGLEANTTYYTRAYAISEGGTGYGEVKSFKTLSLKAPSVSTISASAGSTTTGSANGQLTSLGTSSSVTDYGFCYSSTNQTPTIADTKKGLGSTTNANLAFKAGFDNLIPNTTYYVRAYATSSAGTGYGEVKSFKTAAEIVTPTVGEPYMTSKKQCPIGFPKAQKFYEKDCSITNSIANDKQIIFGFNYSQNTGGEAITQTGICALALTRSNELSQPVYTNNPAEVSTFNLGQGNITNYIYNKISKTGSSKAFTCTPCTPTNPSNPNLGAGNCGNFTSSEYEYKHYLNYYNSSISSLYVINSFIYRFRAFVITASGKVYYSKAVDINISEDDPNICSPKVN